MCLKSIFTKVLNRNKSKPSHSQKGHNHVWKNDFEILGNNYQSNIKRKTNESLYLRQLKPTLNAHEKSIPLQLFN